MQEDLFRIFVGVIFVVLGAVNIYRPSLEWLIKVRNGIRGVNTQITNFTIIYHRISGAILLIIGLIFLIFYS